MLLTKESQSTRKNPVCAILPFNPPKLIVTLSLFTTKWIFDERREQIRAKTKGLYGIKLLAILNSGYLHSSRLSSSRIADCKMGKSPENIYYFDILI